MSTSTRGPGKMGPGWDTSRIQEVCLVYPGRLQNGAKSSLRQVARMARYGSLSSVGVSPNLVAAFSTAVKTKS
jgi:hypothetical protein